MDVKKNIRTYYFYSTFSALIILGPVIVLYYLAKGLSFTQIMTLQSVSAISIFIFEVPTGAIADKFGRKLSMFWGATLWAVSLLLYIIGPGFVTFIFAEIIFSLGAALKSGADIALIYDSLKLSKLEKRFQHIEGHAQSLALYGQAVGSIIAGFVYELNIYLPLIVSVGFMIATMIVTLNFTEPPIEKNNGHKRVNYFTQIKNAGKYIIGHEKIKGLILFTMVFFLFYRNGFWFFQPYMEAVQIPVRYFGILFFLFNVTAAVTAKRVPVIMAKTKPRTLTFLAGLVITSFVIMGFVTIWVGVFAILLQQMARGMFRPVTRKYLNKHIPSDQRATILSFQSLASNIAVAITAPLMGFLKDSSNVFTTHLVLAISMAILIFLVLQYLKKRMGFSADKVV